MRDFSLTPSMPRAVRSLIFLATLLHGCDEPLLEVQTVRGLRVLAARVDAEDEPGRADLEPGETASLRWLVVSDRGASFRAALELCQAEHTDYGIPRCRGDVFAEFEAEGTTREDLSFDFTLPDSFRDGDEWLARLALCEEGTPELRSQGAARCDSGETPLEAYQRATAGVPSPNRNPELGDDALELGGDSWPALEVLLDPGAECDGSEPGLAPVELDRVRELRFELEGEDREELEPSDAYASQPRETLVYSHVLTESGLERPFSFLGPDLADHGFELELRLDRELEVGEGRVVDFALTVRDDRGGADWSRRQLCALAP